MISDERRRSAMVPLAGRGVAQEVHDAGHVFCRGYEAAFFRIDDEPARRQADLAQALAPFADCFVHRRSVQSGKTSPGLKPGSWW